MSKLPWIVGGGIAAYVWSKRKAGPSSVESVRRVSPMAPTPLPTRPSAPTPTPAAPAPRPATLTAPPPRVNAPLTGRWVWPVVKWNDRRPSISDGVGSPRPGGRTHAGVDIMFVRKAADPFRPGTPNGSAGHVMPDNIVAVAASDGVVWSAQQTPRGYAVVIDHSPQKVATFYTHLERIFITPTTRGQSKQRVRAGEPIGIIGPDPLDGAKLKHLHFEVWRGGPNDAVDPAPLMKTWEVIADPRPLNMRNASLVYRPVGARGEPYPDWVRELDGKSGVYVIRERQRDGSMEIVYVGESHTNRLYDTLTRHLQTWRRWKGFWKGQYGVGHDPGLTYDRDRVEVAVRITSPDDALDEEARLIRRLRPRDNLLGQPVEDEVPF
jgi:hypothetical protein